MFEWLKGLFGRNPATKKNEPEIVDAPGTKHHKLDPEANIGTYYGPTGEDPSVEDDYPYAQEIPTDEEFLKTLNIPKGPLNRPDTSDDETEREEELLRRRRQQAQQQEDHKALSAPYEPFGLDPLVIPAGTIFSPGHPLNPFPDSCAIVDPTPRPVESAPEVRDEQPQHVPSGETLQNDCSPSTPPPLPDGGQSSGSTSDFSSPSDYSSPSGTDYGGSCDGGGCSGGDW